MENKNFVAKDFFALFSNSLLFLDFLKSWKDLCNCQLLSYKAIKLWPWTCTMDYKKSFFCKKVEGSASILLFKGYRLRIIITTRFSSSRCLIHLAMLLFLFLERLPFARRPRLTRQGFSETFFPPFLFISMKRKTKYFRVPLGTNESFETVQMRSTQNVIVREHIHIGIRASSKVLFVIYPAELAPNYIPLRPKSWGLAGPTRNPNSYIHIHVGTRLSRW